MRAILSVYDKRGIVDFACGLKRLGWELFSTGGTERALKEAGVEVKSIYELTGFPEILGGRVKTLHPKIFGGILAIRNNPKHIEEIAKADIKTIDLVAVNLYPFKEVVMGGASLETALENIDIGGVSLIRAAAKNYPSVIVVVDPDDYPLILERLSQGEIDIEIRRRLAYKAFLHTAIYDSLISQYLGPEEELPEALPLFLRRGITLRYGENPHQKAGFYLMESLTPQRSILEAERISGGELSHNNLLDIDAALGVIREFEEKPAAVIIKHTNPCGVGVDDELSKAYLKALSGDPVAAFGGVVGLSREVDGETAREIAKMHYDIIIAPSFSPQAKEILSRKKKLVLLALPIPPPPPWEIRRCLGGFLVQTSDKFLSEEFSPKVVTARHPSPDELSDLLFAWKVVRHIKSNAIALAKDQTLIGMGAGQPSRVASVEIAIKKAGERARGSVLASDAFFPFPDSVELAAQAGISAIIQPGGSVKDGEVIATADKFGIAMVFTGVRHFKH